MQADVFPDAIIINNITEFRRIVAKSDFDIEQRDGDNNTPLADSAFYQRYEMVNILLDMGANVDAYGTSRCTALFYLCYYPSTPQATALINRLLDLNPKTYDMPSSNSGYYYRSVGWWAG